ncbi:ABC transporter permease [Halodesulfovibrio aestuarii]|uniref:ABC transporter permease n=1 Tax=Halodesulfovibrio aestuarii TaxID=126333 RepID=A0ABV4JPQ8_9BACT
MLQSSLALFVVGTLTFVLTKALPGDMGYRIAAGRYGHDMVDTAAAELVRQELGLGQSSISAYFHWLMDLLQWNLGESMVSGAPITDILKHEFGSTLTLALAAIAIAAIVGPTLGVLVAFTRSRTVDRLSVALSVATRSIPSYVIGIVLIVVFAIWLDVLPAAGCGEPINYVLPALTLALPLITVSVRITSASLKDVMEQDYFEFSRLKGLGWCQSLLRHGMRNMSIPVIAYHGVQLVYLVEGLVIVETLFAWPGIGHSMAHAIFARDIPMIQGTCMTLALSFILLNTLLDILYRWVDPRERKS